MKCPHCLVEVHPGFARRQLFHHQSALRAKNSKGEVSEWMSEAMVCPGCGKGIIRLLESDLHGVVRATVQVVPFATSRNPVPDEVPADLAEDFIEAALVLGLSPKASAALSRRCLQGILRNNGFAQKDLAPAIKAAVDSGKLPAMLASSLDAVRNIGNFAAHPTKDSNTGEVLPVEPHEAEWNLDVLEGLFDFYYVLPAKEQVKIDALNKKLAAAGKPLLK